MLVVTLKPGERVHVDGPASVENRNGKNMKVAIDAPPSTEIIRCALLKTNGRDVFSPTVLNVNQGGGSDGHYPNGD